MTHEGENMLVRWAKAIAKQGFPIGKDKLQDSEENSERNSFQEL